MRLIASRPVWLAVAFVAACTGDDGSSDDDAAGDATTDDGDADADSADTRGAVPTQNLRSEGSFSAFQPAFTLTYQLAQ